MIFWQFRTDVDSVMVVESSTKTAMSLAQARFQALTANSIPDLGVQGHTVEPLKVEKDMTHQKWFLPAPKLQ